MRIRWSISEKWEHKEIMLAMEAIKFGIDFYDMADDKATLHVKLINDSQYNSSTACRLKNRRYEIRLPKSLLSTTEKLLLALFHEITHTKQYIFNGLRVYSSGKKAQWEGQECEPTDYWFSPWEMEARAMEEPLYRKFMEEN